MMKLTVCIPIYNEAAIVKSTVQALTDALEASAAAHGFEYELLFSDDGSVDACGAMVKEAAASLSPVSGTVSVITAEQNMGKGHAIRLAVAHSTGDIVLYTDCDLAYGVDVITDAVVAITSPDCSDDLLIGSRNLRTDGYEGYTLLRKVASKCYIKLIGLVAGFPFSDSQCGFKVFRGDVARKLFSLGTINGWAFDLEILMMAQRLGYQIKEFPVKIIHHRESKIHLVGDSLRMLRDVYRIKKQIAARFK